MEPVEPDAPVPRIVRKVYTVCSFFEIKMSGTGLRFRGTGENVRKVYTVWPFSLAPRAAIKILNYRRGAPMASVRAPLL